MAKGRLISYCRVSTDRQGRSGLGLDAQRQAVADYLNGGNWILMAEFTEVESGKDNSRPELAKALAACRLKGATLIIAKLGRLSRNAAFLLNLRDSAVDFVCADMPDANRLTIGILAVVAEAEREAISARTKAALAVAKARGVKLGGWKGGPRPNPQVGSEALTRQARTFAAQLKPILTELQSRGLSLRGIARELAEQGIETRRGGKWTPTAVGNVIRRLEGQ